MGEAQAVGYSGVTVSGAGFTGSIPAVPSTGGGAAAGSTARSVGYSGVTIDGAGFTGSAPVATSTSSAVSNNSASEPTRYTIGSGYSDVLEPPIEQYDLSKEFGFIPVAPEESEAHLPYQGIKIPPQDTLSRQLQIADLRASAEAPSGGPRPYADASQYGYSYMRSEIIGRGGAAAATSAMGAWQRAPNSFFPFTVRSVDGSPAVIERRKILILEDRYEGFPMLPPGEHPVEVVEVTPNSFTFRALPGHFDPLDP
ncbi:hypothetical protein [Lentzea californiensis]|uniref:hypothetical protein n=1 Tax=Lentzea californiensis TaxID=438851 RepID=UPI0021652664|nr:hypothetical protein [Lentzea californiensis]MCR3752667.1 hypothetical protein [Lentzea californiensis]